MRLLLDTNIIIDIITKRKGYEASLQILKCCEINIADGFVTATTVTDLMYILRKHISPEGVRDVVQKLLVVIDVAGVLKSDISAAFLSGMKDFEDAVQASCAGRIKADYIVTRNAKDFAESPVSAILPEKAIKLLS